MFVINLGRGCGKTTTLLNLARQTDATILTFNPAYAKYLALKTHAENVKIVPFSYLKDRLPTNHPFLVDDIDAYCRLADIPIQELQRIINTLEREGMIGYSITTENEEN